jgi:hypothetical protein
MIRIKAKIDGGAQLRDLLRDLEPATQRRVLRPAITQEAGILAKELKPAVAEGKTKLLKKSIGKKVKTYARTNAVVGIVGPRTGFAQVIDGHKHDPAKYGHLVEGGTKAHDITIRKRHGQPITPFTIHHPGARAQRTFSRAAASSVRTAGPRLTARIAVEIEKLAAKGKLK